MPISKSVAAPASMPSATHARYNVAGADARARLLRFVEDFPSLTPFSLIAGILTVDRRVSTEQLRRALVRLEKEGVVRRRRFGRENSWARTAPSAGPVG